MISLQKTGNAIKFTFDDNGRYLYNGTIEVPVNSLTLVTDGSDMFTFKKSATNDIFVSGLYSEIGMTKAELISFYKNNMVDSFINADDAQSMIDESISGKADYSAATIVNDEDVTITSASTSSQNVDDTFNYNDGIYFVSGYSFHLNSNFQGFSIKISDGTNETTVNRNQTGDTANYTFTINSSDFVLQTKGLYRITELNVNMDEAKTFQRIYKYQTTVEKAVSTVISDEIEPELSSITATLNTKADASATTVTMTESGTVDGSAALYHNTAFTYSDGVYYYSGNSRDFYSNIKTFYITYSDETNSYTVNKTDTGDTDNYTFTFSGNNLEFQTKGAYKIRQVYIYVEDLENISYSYKYSRDVEKSVSAAILELDARVRALEEAQNNS